jgi:hypothetical protein
MSARSEEDRYFFVSNNFSNSKICFPLNVVLAFLLLLLDDCFVVFPLADDGLPGSAPLLTTDAAGLGTPALLLSSGWLISSGWWWLFWSEPGVLVSPSTDFDELSGGVTEESEEAGEEERGGVLELGLLLMLTIDPELVVEALVLMITVCCW